MNNKINIYFVSFLIELIIGILYTFAIVNFISGGLTLSEACFSWAIYMLTISLFELPTGFVADKYGRKASSIFGVAIITAAAAVLVINFHPYAVYLSVFLSGLGFTMVSGAKTAWFIDIFKNTHTHEQIGPFIVNLDIFRRLALIVGAMVAGVLTPIGAEFLWLLMTIIGLVSLVFAFRLDAGQKSTPLQDHTIDSASLRALWRDVSTDHRLFVFFALFYSTTLFFSLNFGIMDVLLQPYSLTQIFDEKLIMVAILYSGMHIFGIVGAQIYKRYKIRQTSTNLIFLLMVPLMLSLGQIVAVSIHEALLFMALWWIFYSCMGWFYPVRSIIITTHCNERYTATMLSIDSFVDSLARSLISLFVGWILLSEDPVQTYPYLWYLGIGLLAGMSAVLMIILIKERERERCQAV